MVKEHKVLKFFIPLLSIAFGVGLSFLSSIVIDENEFYVHQYLTSNLIELLEIALTLLIVIKIYPNLFPNSKNFKIQLPNSKTILGLILISPMILILGNVVLYELICMTGKDLVTQPFVTDTVAEDLIASISAIFLAPLIEELTFRYMTLTPFGKRIPRIFVLLFTSTIFGILHVRNFFLSFFHAILYGSVFLTTKNITYSILLHALDNLMITLFGLACTIGLGGIEYSPSPVILIFSDAIQIFFAFVATVGIGLLIFGNNPKNKS